MRSKTVHVSGQVADMWKPTGIVIPSAILPFDKTPAYVAAVLSDSPAGYWKLDELSGNFADSSGNGNTLTASGSITYRSLGPMQYAATFATGSKGSHANVTSSINAVALEAWVYLTGNAALQDVLINSGSNNGYNMLIDTNRKVNLLAQNVAFEVGTTALALNVWNHIVCTRTGVSQQWRSYINGAIDNATMGNANPATLSGAATAVGNTTMNAGRIAHAAIYAADLTTARVLAHYQAATA